MSSSSTTLTPQATELYRIFENVLGSFAFLNCDYIGTPVEGPSESLTTECLLKLEGLAKGTLVLRCDPAISVMLARVVRGEHGADGAESADAFRELCNLFAGHLITEHWGKKGIPFAGFLPQASDPSAWPKEEASAACALLVEGLPLEIRLWLRERS